MVKQKAKTKRPQKKPARKKGVTQPDELTIPQLVAGVGVSDTTLKKYFARGCPRTSVEAVLRWRSENIKAVAEDADVSELGIEYKRADIADKLESARAKRIKNDRADGSLVLRAEVSRELSIILSRFHNRVVSIPSDVAIVCPDPLKVPIKNAVESVITVALKEIVDGISEWE
jgi:hypothetical protein